MKTAVVCFPFDQFGSAGTGEGALRLMDVVEEILEDADRESTPTRAAAYRENVTLNEVAFDSMAELQEWHATGLELAQRELTASDFLIWLAGNHLGALPLFEALGDGALVVQLDAHLDIQEFDDSPEEPSHGNFLLHLPKPRPKFINVGHRDLLMQPAKIKKAFDATFSAEDVALDPARVLADIRKRAKSASRVWLDLDCDALDPAHLPAVQGPLPFGLSPAFLLQVVNAIGFDKLGGVSISEFDPGRDHRESSLQLLGWFVEWLLVRTAES